MKKILSFIIAGNLVIACNSSSNSSTSTDSTSTNQTNVENVNGNLPDSSAGINLNQPLPVDSSRLKDSLKKDSARR